MFPFPCGWWTCAIILFDYFNWSRINSFSIIWCSLLLLINSFNIILIFITYYSSTPFVLFDHPYYLLRFISVFFFFFFFFLLFFFSYPYHIFNVGWLMQMPYITPVLLFITHQHFLYYLIINIITLIISVYFIFSSHISLLMADANAIYHFSLIISYSWTHYYPSTICFCMDDANFTYHPSLIIYYS